MLSLAIIVPIYNERKNVRPLVERLEKVLHGIEWEVIFVDDDSPDGTAATVRDLAAANSHVRILQRVGRRGLAGACIEGMMATAAPFIAVMDADLQHDETVLPAMLRLIESGKYDLVVGSRNVPGGSMGDFAKERVALSRIGGFLSRLVCRCALSDPMSGYFLVTRRFLEDVVHRVSGVGFKIFLDLVASAKEPVRIAEVPYHFRARRHGESKLDIKISLEYLYLIVDKWVGDLLPTRFLLFVCVGILGLLLHLAVLGTLLWRFHVSFLSGQLVATALAMTLNFLLNNVITYRDRRLKGWQLLRGLLVFYVACTVGAVTSLTLAQAAYNSGLTWYIAGVLGMAVSSVWNYGVTTVFTWRQSKGRRFTTPQRTRDLEVLENPDQLPESLFSSRVR